MYVIQEFLNKYKVLDIPYPYPFEGYLYPSGEEEGVSVGEGVGEEEDIKHRYGEFQKVLLTDNEYAKLLEKLGGEEKRAHWIKTFDEGLYQKKYKYTSHYMAILSWERKEEDKPDPNFWKTSAQ